ncbi:beta-phosphoglucomutase [Paenibacillus sp. SYP-B3998]|uniref:Beta-phosphoglucomutase n=1 Tax=Paenibacillus sp. SYP-B3998 TaxID=2678564 RepID=A0A6G3ZR39_9BACL|nr:beta-phosphoglucomutase [Paenibacillus sp. SYP-B3998]NEW04673.1 beta-phosphoglucomutase [Paenibacillus sp. SYP-B3998]
MSILAVIFDLDGVLVHTDQYHYQAWKRMADEEGIVFDESVNDRLRGVSRMESLEVILEKSGRTYTSVEKEALAEKKNGYYRELLDRLTPADAAPGSREIIAACKQQGTKVAIGSSSRNTPVILERLGLTHMFEAVADGNEIVNSKPDPEVFLLAAKKLAIDPECCIVVEDAEAGLVAAKRAGMKTAAMGTMINSPTADYRLHRLDELKAVIWG